MMAFQRYIQKALIPWLHCYLRGTKKCPQGLEKAFAIKMIDRTHSCQEMKKDERKDRTDRHLIHDERSIHRVSRSKNSLSGSTPERDLRTWSLARRYDSERFKRYPENIHSQSFARLPRFRSPDTTNKRNEHSCGKPKNEKRSLTWSSFENSPLHQDRSTDIESLQWNFRRNESSWITRKYFDSWRNMICSQRYEERIPTGWCKKQHKNTGRHRIYWIVNSGLDFHTGNSERISPTYLTRGNGAIFLSSRIWQLLKYSHGRFHSAWV